jgi:precorrin-2 dehydrogenase/sirohydrochlorin ferrochelatase
LYYPAFLDLKGKDCVVIGGGKVSLRKVNSLINCGARIFVFAPEIVPELESLAQAGKIIFEKKTYESDDLVGASLVICATDDSELNADIAREAKDRGLLVNVVNEPEVGNFIVPSTLRRGKLAIAVSTGGTSPALAKKIREKLEGEFGPEYELFLEAMENFRKKAQQKLNEEERKEFFSRLVDSDLMDKIRSGWNAGRLEEAIEEQMNQFLTHENR